MPGMIKNRPKFYLLLAFLSVQLAFGNADSIAAEAYAQRGDQIELLYEDYTAGLQAAFETLRQDVASTAPRLLPRLDPPKRQEYGYQILPRIIPHDLEAACTSTDDLPAQPRYRPRSSRFSWVITQTRIQRQVEQIKRRLTSKLNRLEKLSRPERLSVIEQAVDDYLELKKQHRAIDRLIQHNWLWQKEISKRKPRYDRSTRLHDAIMERAALQTALTAEKDADFHQALQRTRFAESRQSRADLEADIRARVAALSRQIQMAARGLTPRDYVDPVARGSNLWVMEVPVYTDIEDQAYLRQLARAIETRWCLDDGQLRFRLDITFIPVATRTLYASELAASESGKSVPGFGDTIDLTAHCNRFPSAGARVSSGAKKSYVIDGCFYLGPADIGPNTLAHEFGHLLGFADEYVRGYRDLGAAGYEILEILPDDTDLMASTGRGGVHRFHFDALIAGATYRRLYQQGNASMSAERYVEAVGFYRQAIDASYNDVMAAGAYNNLGWSLTKLQRYREAVAAYEKALRARPEYQRARDNLQWVRSLQEASE